MDNYYSNQNFNTSPYHSPRLGKSTLNTFYEYGIQDRDLANEERYRDPRDLPTPYFLRLQNEELSNNLFQERRINRDVSKQLDEKYSQVEVMSKNLSSKTEELDSLNKQFAQSEQIRQEQSKLIESIQKELDYLREELKKQNEKEEEESTKKGEKQAAKVKVDPKATTSSNKPGLAQASGAKTKNQSSISTKK